MKKRVLFAFGAATLLCGVALPAFAQTAETDVLPSETFTDINVHNLPTPPVHPGRYTLPMRTVVVKDASLTSDSPLSDQFKYGSTEDLQRWAEAVRDCLKQKPVMARKVGDKEVRFVVNKAEGKLKLNANNKPVCIL
jgi:hypothetical protein